MTTKKQPIDQTLIRQLAMLLNETDLSEIEVERDDLRIRVARQVTMTTIAPVSAAPQIQAAPVSRTSEIETPTVPAAAAAPSKGQPIPSPMVGTAYLSPKPGDAAFVSVGDKVREGETLLIIEAMKHMNQIPSPKSGTVLEILVEDGGPVEFGESLILIDPA